MLLIFPSSFLCIKQEYQFHPRSSSMVKIVLHEPLDRQMLFQDPKVQNYLTKLRNMVEGTSFHNENFMKFIKLDVFKQIKHTIYWSKKYHNLTATRWQFLQWLHLLSDRSGKIGRFEPMQPVMIQQTHNYQARMVSWLEDVGRFAHFFLAKWVKQIFDMICIKMLLKFRAFACRWWIHSFLTFASILMIPVQNKKLWGNVMSISFVTSHICLESSGSRASQLSQWSFFYQQTPECVPRTLESNKEVWPDCQSFRRVPVFSR